MAYAPSNNWWLNGPTDPRGWGCDSPRGCGSGFAGFRGLGQAMTCQDGSPYLANFGCDDGSTPACSSGYTLSVGASGYQCTSAAGSIFAGTPAPSAVVSNILCPVGATCSIIPGVSNTYVYIGGGFLALMLLLAGKR